VSYTFQGSAVDWITASGPDEGLVDVYLDGSSSSASHVSATRLTQQLVFSATGLRSGKHTFMAVKASGDVMRTDVIRYTFHERGWPGRAGGLGPASPGAEIPCHARRLPGLLGHRSR